MGFPMKYSKLVTSLSLAFKPVRVLALTGAVLGALALGGVVSLAPHHSAQAQAQAPAAQPQVRGLPDFTDLVEQVGPSVVNIRTLEKTRAAAAGGGGSGGPSDEEMQEFFRRFFGMPLPGTPGAPGGRGTPPNTPRRDAPQEERETPRGVGSGFILSADGYVMTNAHVVDGADEVLVTLPDKREFKAKIIGFDKRTDVAVVKIEATGLPAVKIGDVNRLKVGEWVMAIGSPFGLENTVTAGIVSAKQRDTGDYLPFIQTDVAINPGNSGGPLINLRGEVVGINSQIYSRSGGFMGISFAIPIDEATRVSDQLRTTGKVQRGRLGVQIGNVSKEVAESMGLAKPAGAFVSMVEKASPAEKAGVEAGDIITKFDGKPIDKSTDLPRMVGNTKPGTKSTLTVFRRGNARDVGITVGEVEEQKVAAAPRSAAPERKPEPAGAGQPLGLALADLTEAQKKELGVKGGVRIETAEGAGARAGLRTGDVLTAVANTEVSNLKEFEAAMARADKTKPLLVLYLREGRVQPAVIRR
jgi:serine protease Do